MRTDFRIFCSKNERGNLKSNLLMLHAENLIRLRLSFYGVDNLKI